MFSTKSSSSHRTLKSVSARAHTQHVSTQSRTHTRACAARTSAGTAQNTTPQHTHHNTHKSQHTQKQEHLSNKQTQHNNKNTILNPKQTNPHTADDKPRIKAEPTLSPPPLEPGSPVLSSQSPKQGPMPPPSNTPIWHEREHRLQPDGRVSPHLPNTGAERAGTGQRGRGCSPSPNYPLPSPRSRSRSPIPPYQSRATLTQNRVRSYSTVFCPQSPQLQSYPPGPPSR